MEQDFQSEVFPRPFSALVDVDVCAMSEKGYVKAENEDHYLVVRGGRAEQLFFFPNLTSGGEYRVNFDTSLVMDVTRRIGWQLTLSDRYLSNPPFGLERNDLLLTTGLKIKLGEFK